MLGTAAVKPSPAQLNSFIARISSFPVTAAQLSKIGARLGAPKDVIRFYKSFAPDRVFEDEEDLAASTEQIEIMRGEQPEMPREEEVATEEY